MPLCFITGPSGCGKSTLTKELIRRGYEAYDTDDDAGWYDTRTNQFMPSDWADPLSPPPISTVADTNGEFMTRQSRSTEITENMLERKPSFFSAMQQTKLLLWMR